MNSLEVKWVRLHEDAVLPTKAHDDDAAFDLVCVEDASITSGQSVDISTGVAIAMPPGWWARIIGRSSTLRRRGLLVVEGVIDAGFRGELYSGVLNVGTETVHVEAGERLAQMLFLPVPTVHWVEVKELPESSRGVNGFGSSGR